MNLIVYADGYLKAGDKVYPAVYGKNGIGFKLCEGDGVSPEGTWPLRRAFYRSDRLGEPTTDICIEAIKPEFAWCDIVGDPKYNQFVTLPYPTADEKLWREDHLYDIVVVIGYNDNPVVDGLGSAIFFHIVRPAYTPSTGCASVSMEHMLEILPMLDEGSSLTFTRETLMGEPVKWKYRPPQPV